MINATSVLEVGKNVVELVTDIMKWDIGLFFLRSRREPSLLKLLYEKGLGLEQEDIGNISYKKELLSTDVLLRPYIYKVDDVNEQWKAEKAIYSETVQVKLQNMKRVFVFPLNSPYIGEIGVLKGYSTSTIAVADEEFEFEYLRVIEYIAKCGAATCERIRRQESMIPNTTNEEDE
jgi:hypothetical protein